MAVQVRHAMTQDPKTLSAERSVGDAAGLMSQYDIGSIPVVDGDSCVGIVTDRDLVVRVMSERRDPDAVTLGEILTKDVTTVSPDVELHEARDIMERDKVRRLPVVKDGRLVGILSLGDVAVTLASKRVVGEALSGISESPSTLGLNPGPAIGTPESARGSNG